MKKFISIILCALILVGIMSFAGCKELNMSGPEKALTKFETAINERDFEGVIEIFTPDQQAELKMQLKLVEGLAGAFGDYAGVGGMDFLFSEEMIGSAFGIALEDYYIDIEIISEEYNENKTKANVTVKLTSGEEATTEVFPMVEISGKWYVDLDITN